MKEKIMMAVAIILTTVAVTTSIIYARDYSLLITGENTDVAEATRIRVGDSLKPGDRLIWQRTGVAYGDLTITVNYNDGKDPDTKVLGGNEDTLRLTMTVSNRGIKNLDHWVVRSNNLGGAASNGTLKWNLSLDPVYGKDKGGSGHDDGEDEEEGSTAFSQDPDTLILIRYIAANADITPKTKIGKQEQGALAKQLLKGSVPAGWSELLTFNMTIDDKADQSLKNGQMVFCPPVRHLKAGRQFAVLGIDKSGRVKVYNDLDKDPGTITVQLDLEGYAFDLICTDR